MAMAIRCCFEGLTAPQYSEIKGLGVVSCLQIIAVPDTMEYDAARNCLKLAHMNLRRLIS